MAQPRILIIKLGSLGDVVQAEGAYRDIRGHHLQAHIIVMTTPPYRRFFERCPWVDEVVIDRRDPRWNLAKMLALRSRMRRLGVEMVYDLQQVRRTHFYFRWFLCDVDWMGKAPGCRYRFSHVAGRCALDQFADQFARLGIANDHVLKADLGWMADDMSGLLAEAGVTPPYAVLIPGASAGHERKRWPYYDELAGWLRGRGITPVTVPGPDEMALCHSFVNAMALADGNRYLDYFELAGVLRQAAFVIGNDTGPLHIAAHLQRPGLGLFSSHTPATTTGIQHSRFTWLEAGNLPDLPLAAVQQEMLSRGLLAASRS